MDPTIASIVSAVAVGFAAAAKDTAQQAVKDAYAGLKKLIEDRYQVGLSNMEQRPTSDSQKSAVAEALQEKNAQNDADLVAKAQSVIEAVQTYDPDPAKTAGSVGVEWIRVKVDVLNVKTIRGGEGGTAFRAVDSEFKTVNMDDLNPKADPKN